MSVSGKRGLCNIELVKCESHTPCNTHDFLQPLLSWRVLILSLSTAALTPSRVTKLGRLGSGSGSGRV